MQRFKTVLVPELNMGQLALLLRAKYVREVVTLNKVQGRPFKAIEIAEKIDEVLASGQQRVNMNDGVRSKRA
jgi:2-oxoglutarate ferredoxin oxidoreductase subunit alpha